MGKYDTGIFVGKLKKLGIVLEEEQLQQFIDYYELLVEWNQCMNLTAITEYEEVIEKHFVDSLSLVKACRLQEELNNHIPLRMIDVGTGAGFPGIPLKIVFPGLQVTLLDSLKKRVGFLDEVIGRLGLKDIEALHGRAEDYAGSPVQCHGQDRVMLREKYDICVSRAVANLSTLSELCIPFVRIGGIFLSYKSEKAEEEVKAAGRAVSVLGGKITGQERFRLPDSDIYRNIVIIHKIKETPGKYPRKAGIPSREPIAAS